MARQVAATILKDGEVVRGYIGVQTRELTAELAEALKLGDGKGVLVPYGTALILAAVSLGTTIVVAAYSKGFLKLIPILAGVIVGYTVRLRPDAEPNEIHAWMSIAVEGNETRAVIASLLGEPGVASLHDTNGRWDLLAELRAANLSELSQVLERIRLVRGISNTETSIHLQTYRLS
jgi:hypothetical protein